MQIVSDRGMDMAPEQMVGIDIHLAPLTITLNGKSYRSGIDIQSEEFYRLLDETGSFPTTSQPSAGDFAEIYKKLAEQGEEILSIHISSGLSGTLQSAKAGAALVPEAKVMIVDSKTLSCPFGWQVEAAARAAKAGWAMPKIIEMLQSISDVTDGVFTLSTLKYLIHGGRINHLKGLIASLLNVKPIIGVEKARGTYISHGQEITSKRAIRRLVDLIASWYSEGTKMRFQLLHGNNPEGIELLQHHLRQTFECVFLPSVRVAPVLGAHTGAGLIGLALAPALAFPELP